MAMQILTMRTFVLLIAFLLPVLDVIFAEEKNYEAFLLSGAPNEFEWTVGDLGTGATEDLIDASPLEYTVESYDQDFPLDVASTGDRCSSGDILRRGVDDLCGSNLGPQERPLVIPNLGTLDLNGLCPKKSLALGSILVCASKDPQNIQRSIFTGTSLYESERGAFLVFVRSFSNSDDHSDDDDDDDEF